VHDTNQGGLKVRIPASRGLYRTLAWVRGRFESCPKQLIRLASRIRPCLPLVCSASGAAVRDARIREADLLQLAQIASTYPSRQRFLTELTLDPPTTTSGEAGVPLRDEDYLILSTIHSAKGQEWTSVFVLNCVVA
jgi:hypothetical protein